MPQSNDLIVQFNQVGVSPGDRGQRLGRCYPQQGNIFIRGDVKHGRVQFFTGLQGHLDVLGAKDDMCVGGDHAVLVKDDPGAGGGEHADFAF